MCGGSLTFATRMEGVSKYDALPVLLNKSGTLAQYFLFCKIRCISCAISGICGDLWRTTVPAGGHHGPVHTGRGCHLLEKTMPNSRRYSDYDTLQSSKT